MYVGMHATSLSFLISLVYTRYCLPIREENLSAKASREACVLYLDAFTSMGQIFGSSVVSVGEIPA